MFDPQALESSEIAALLETCETALRDFLPEVLRRAEAILSVEYGVHEPMSVHKLHGRIAEKIPRAVDIVNAKFSDPQHYKAEFLAGLVRNADADRLYWESTSKRYPPRGSVQFMKLLQDEVIRDYIMWYLERNFYRQLRARTRSKPNESAWSLWFGANQMIWGLLIAPVFRVDKWINDVSEIRRVKYDYWTVGHVLEEGFVDPSSSTTYKIGSPKQLMQFYRSVLKRLSNAHYEQPIIDRYEAYLASSSDVYSEPLLIPELRYAGLNSNHVHRLDFTVLNSHVMEFTGFELSPSSTHMAISGKSGKLQKDINAELSSKWDKEMSKRNEYFLGYGITVMTFTDRHLLDLDRCFSTIASSLRARPQNRVSLQAQLRRVAQFGT